MVTSRGIYDEFVPFYDLVYPERQDEVTFYTSLLRRGDRSVLELGCGTGVIIAGLATELHAPNGLPVRAVGIDHSIAMLRQARRQGGVCWIQGDMSRPAVRGAFDFVVCAFNTLQMLDSDDAVLRTLRASRALLGSSGRFVFDIYNASRDSGQTAPESRINRVVRSFTDMDGHRLEVREDAIEASDGQSVQLDWRVLEVSAQPILQRARLLLRLRHYTAAAVDTLLSAAGMRVIEKFGDVRRSPFDERTSTKQVVVCGPR